MNLKKDIFLYLKSQSQDIITFEFIFLFNQLNLAFFLFEKRKKIVQKIRLIETKVIEVF